MAYVLALIIQSGVVGSNLKRWPVFGIALLAFGSIVVAIGYSLGNIRH